MRLWLSHSFILHQQPPKSPTYTIAIVVHLFYVSVLCSALIFLLPIISAAVSLNSLCYWYFLMVQKFFTSCFSLLAIFLAESLQFQFQSPDACLCLLFIHSSSFFSETKSLKLPKMFFHVNWMMWQLCKALVEGPNSLTHAKETSLGEWPNQLKSFWSDVLLPGSVIHLPLLSFLPK